MKTVSENKFSVSEIMIGDTPATEKPWVVVEFHRSGQKWVPSFEDIYRILRPIGELEEAKYPQVNGARGRRFVSDFVTEMMTSPSTEWPDLRDMFKIPSRGYQRVSTQSLKAIW